MEEGLRPSDEDDEDSQLKTRIMTMRKFYVSRKHLISFTAANQPKPERRIIRMEETRMVFRRQLVVSPGSNSAWVV